MAKLNDTQLVLLSTAAQRETSSLYPLPASMLDGEAVSDRAAKAIAQLLKRNLLEERETTDGTATVRTDNDVRYGIFITASGIATIGVDQGEQAAPSDGTAPPPNMPSAQLRERWVQVTGNVVPRISPKLLRLALAYELQASAYGGLSRRAQQQLAAGKTRTQATLPGTQLVREWSGRIHVVIVGEDRVICWNDREWRSLSEVARAITGTRWSGPAFFGLKRRAAA